MDVLFSALFFNWIIYCILHVIPLLTVEYYLGDKCNANPQFSFPDEVSHITGVFGVISEMVGDIQRIMKYPDLGFQIHHSLPEYVLAAYEYLIKEGFIHHLIKESNND